MVNSPFAALPAELSNAIYDLVLTYEKSVAIKRAYGQIHSSIDQS